MSEAKRKLEAAWWTSPRSGTIELTRDWRAERLPPLTLAPDRAFARLERASPLTFAATSGYFLDGEWVVFCFFPELYAAADVTEEEIFVAGSFNNWAEAIGNRIWRLERREYEGRELLALKYRPPGGLKEPLPFKFVTGSGAWLEPPEDANLMLVEGVQNMRVSPKRTGLHLFAFEVAEEHGLAIVDRVVWRWQDHEESVEIQPGRYLRTVRSDEDLGAIVEPERTTFRVFAPRATKVTVVYYDNLEAKHAVTRELSFRDGIWEVAEDRNLHGWYYHFHVDGQNSGNDTNFDPTFPILDPYAKACISAKGPGVIVDPSTIARPERKFVPPYWQDLVICEAHVRDLIARTSLPLTDDERLGFTGLAKFIRSKASYFRELRVNAVEFQPLQEFDNESREEYHWGYMTCNFFSPDSTYALEPEKASQIAEFQDVVAACHEQNLAVLLDVVYNHVGVPSHLIYLDKYYYFELDHEANLTNWSGVGNDLRCSAPMAKRLIIDSLKWLVEVYDVDGFRFDLAELIGLDVLQEIETELKKVKPSVILIAEPWSFRGHLAWALKKTGYAYWNDGFREFITKYVTGGGNQDGMRYFLAGSISHLARFPAQSVNYVESHDDFAFLDRITERDEHNGFHPTDNDQKRVRLALAIVLASLGIPMIAAGQDFARSKQGVHNTYQRGDLNALEYTRAKEYAETAEYVRNWVRFRRAPASRALRLRDRPADSYFRFYGVENTSATGMLANANETSSGPQVFFAANPHEHGVSLWLDGLDLGSWTHYADGRQFDPRGIEGSDVHLRDGHLDLPPISCALFVRE